MTERKTDEEILEEYLREMEFPPFGQGKTEQAIRAALLECVGIARKEEPRINSGIQYIDWLNIVDEDDDFESFYGPDYFDKG